MARCGIGKRGKGDMLERIWQRPSKLFAILILSVIVLVPALFLLWFGLGVNLDDALISYRYAQHLAAGQGLVWNVGDAPVEGYTNFLFVVLIALGMFFRVEP